MSHISVKSASMGSFGELSTAAQIVLVISGLSVGLVLYLLLRSLVRTVNAVRSALSSALSPPSKKKIKKSRSTSSSESAALLQPADAGAKKAPGKSIKNLQKELRNKGPSAPAGEDKATHHDRYLNTLLGHGDMVNGLDFSPDGSLLASACEDRVVRLYHVSDVCTEKPKLQRIKVNWSVHDVVIGDGNIVAVRNTGMGASDMLVCKQDEKGAWQVDEQAVSDIHMNDESIGLVSASQPSADRRRVMASCSTKKDIVVFNTQGKELGRLEPGGMKNHMAALSRDGRFIAAATFIADVKVWEIKAARSPAQEFQGIAKVMDLKGHKKGIRCLAFNEDSTRMVTASLDGQLRVWNLAVRYHQQEDPKCLVTAAQHVPAKQCYSHICWPPGDVIVAVVGRTLHFLHAADGALIDAVEAAHNKDITYLLAAPVKYALRDGSRSAVVATAGKDNKVRLWSVPEVLH